MQFEKSPQHPLLPPADSNTPTPAAVEVGLLTTGPPEKSHCCHFLFFFFFFKETSPIKTSWKQNFMELRNTFVYIDSSFLCSFFNDKETSRIPESEMNNIQPCGNLTNLLIRIILFHFPLLLCYIPRQPSEGGSAGGKEKGEGESQGV